VNRREFLSGVAAVAVGHLLPTVPFDAADVVFSPCVALPEWLVSGEWVWRRTSYGVCIIRNGHLAELLNADPKALD
jgi:hypothetical protein